MKCLYCAADTTVIETRSYTTAGGTYSVRRRRKCSRCTRTFFTRELVYHGAHNHKLTEKEVRYMRRLKTELPGVSNRTLAEKFGVTQPTVSRILNGLRWPKAELERNGNKDAADD